MAGLVRKSTPAERRGPNPDRRRALTALGAALLVLAGAWAFDLWWLKTPVLTPFRGHPPLTPLFAFLLPVLRPSAVLFLLVAAGLVASVTRLTDVERTSARVFVAALAGAALVLPIAGFLIRESLADLGSHLTFYRGEEIYYDAERIRQLRGFLANYVELMPKLSLHGAHYPPGFATLFYGVRQGFSATTFAAGLASLLLFVPGIPLAYAAFRELHGDSAARRAALILLACPALVDFGCASNDAVFFTLATLALWTSIAAFAPERNLAWAIASGLCLLVATLFSFSGLPVMFLVLLYALGLLPSQGKCVTWRLGAIGLSYGLGIGLLLVSTHFDLIRCFVVARAENQKLAERLDQAFLIPIAGVTRDDLYLNICFGNLVGFAVGAGLSIAAALILRFVSSPRPASPFTPAVAIALAVMTFGGMHYMETERVWLYAIPWLVAVALPAVETWSIPVLRVLLAAGLVQTFLMEVFLFTYW